MEKRTRLRLSVGGFADDGDRKISGLALPYGTQTMRVPKAIGMGNAKRIGFKVFQGALGDIEDDPSIKLLYSHDENQILGLNGDNMSLNDSADGVRMQANLLEDDPFAESIYSRIKRNWIKEMSPGIVWMYGDGGPTDIEQPDADTAIFVFGKDAGIRLDEVSILPRGAFNGTSVGVRGQDDSFGLADSESFDVVSKLIDEFVDRKPVVPVGIDLMEVM